MRTCLREGSLLDVSRNKISDCLFLNISMHGACLKLPAELPLPQKLILFDERLALNVAAEVRWQRGREVGVYVRNGVQSWIPRLNSVMTTDLPELRGTVSF